MSGAHENETSRMQSPQRTFQTTQLMEDACINEVHPAALSPVFGRGCQQQEEICFTHPIRQAAGIERY